MNKDILAAKRMTDSTILWDSIDRLRAHYGVHAVKYPDISDKIDNFLDSIEAAWTQSGLSDYWSDVEEKGVKAEKVLRTW